MKYFQVIPKIKVESLKEKPTGVDARRKHPPTLGGC
jgi:hypothetical protein